ncbi:MAG: ATP-binding domain-containing protein [Lachnospiraceae bacterium]|nr:ATP-binding domain-containing protein [Lachnospiraceae bacterium]
MDKSREHIAETDFFDSVIKVIEENTAAYETEYDKYREETRELFSAMQNGDIELYDRMITSRSLSEHAENQLRKNKLALLRPYFGRIDFTDIGFKKEESLYIGKNGIYKNRTDMLIADWRAPVSSIYYENEIGHGSYPLPDMTGRKNQPKSAEYENVALVDLHLKRTYDIENGNFNGYYDSDVAASDELLIKYLSQNRDAVLGEIIATIQKEQNAVIRESPFANIIVQGVAGSGKTTVAIHRMSYILFNYKERFEPNEFCVIGSNDLLLNYITGGLPELDVNQTKKMRMDELFVHLLGKEWKSKYKILEETPDSGRRSNYSFVKELEHFLAARKSSLVKTDAVKDISLGVLLTKSSNETLYNDRPDYSAYRLLMAMDERILSRIKSFTGQFEKQDIDKKRKEYNRFCTGKFPKISVIELYLEFLGTALNDDEKAHLFNLRKGFFDIYDVAAMVLIYYRIFQKGPNEEFGLLFIDEAQDFGSGIYYVLKQVLPECYFTIMGDVSQNINYEAGMNDWDEIRSFFLTGEKDKFNILAKSYRNTIEISQYAGRVLERASAGRYKITPVIRHGSAVSEEEYWSIGEMAERAGKLLEESYERGYQTAAVICHDDKEAEKVRGLVAGDVVYPIRLTKGLEFDVVILWNPQKIEKIAGPKEAKLLYVAATRALHELHVLRC